MTRRLARTAAVLAAVVFAVGCASSHRPTAGGGPLFTATPSVAYGTFVKQEQADLRPSAPLVALDFVGDTLLGRTDTNRVYALTKTLDLRYVQQVADPGEAVRTPVAVGKETCFPTVTHLRFYNDNGDVTKTIELPYPMTSNVQLDPRGLLLAGTAANTGGRVTMIDPQNRKKPVSEDTLVGTVLSGPVAFQGVVYVANEAGKVFAVGAENRSLWPLADRGFKTNRAVTADLAVDEYALYVASTDSVLYVLDRTTGRIKWRYMAQTPLRVEPLVTKDRVFLVVPGRGVVALNKTDGQPYRVPLWTTPGVTRTLGVDDKYLYAVVGKNELVAIDLATGDVRFDVSGPFDLFAAGPDHRLYAATRGGAVVSFARAAYSGDEATIAVAR